MIQIIIVEDDKEMQKELKKILKEIKLGREEIKIEVHTKFTNKLKEIIKEESERKIYIMDIELEGKVNGIDIAKYIRDKNDWESEIIFITSHDKMFETAYRSVYEIFDFIEKFHHLESRLKKDLAIIYKKDFDKKMFKYKNRNVDVQIFYKSITHICRDKETRKLIINTEKRKYTLNLNVTEALKYLDNRFKLVHRACIVNTEKVEYYNWSKGSFILETGEEINMLSKKYKKEIDKINEKIS